MIKVKRKADGAVFFVGHGSVEAEDPENAEEATLIRDSFMEGLYFEGLHSHSPLEELLAQEILRWGGGGTTEIEQTTEPDNDLDILY